jgi:hypothetical protein
MVTFFAVITLIIAAALVADVVGTIRADRADRRRWSR